MPVFSASNVPRLNFRHLTTTQPESSSAWGQPADIPTDETQPGLYLTNESRVLRDLYVDLRAEFGEVDAYVDLHHMGPCSQQNDTDQVTVAVDFPPLGSEALGNPRYADWPLLDQDKSRRYALAAALGLQEHAGQGKCGDVAVLRLGQPLHPPTDRRRVQLRPRLRRPGTVGVRTQRHRYTVLFELRSQSDEWGQKQLGQLVHVVLAGVFGIAERMADGSVDTLNGDDFYNPPKYR